MDDVVTAQLENENLRKVHNRLLQWEASINPLANLNSEQEELLGIIETTCYHSDNKDVINTDIEDNKARIFYLVETTEALTNNCSETSRILEEKVKMRSDFETINDFLLWYNEMHSVIHETTNTFAENYLEQLTIRNMECRNILEQLAQSMECLNKLRDEYSFVSDKTKALNSTSEQLIEEQEQLQILADNIQYRLNYFNQVEVLNQRLQNPTLSVSSDSFRECLMKIDECLLYLKKHPKYKDASAFVIKYKHCLNKAIGLIRNYAQYIMGQATAATLNPKQSLLNAEENIHTSPDAAFALYYGKYQMSAVKFKRISQLVETRVNTFQEYNQLLEDLQQCYLNERSAIMVPAISKALKDIQAQHKADHCALMRNTCAFLVHICQDEHRLYFQFFANDSELLTLYLEGLCNILYDIMRPIIIHINHLETLAEICSILRVEMLEEHVQQNPLVLVSFGSIANQLLQDVQERLVFRAHLYLQSDIASYKPSEGDLTYPEKLEMMESIALSLQESAKLRRSESKSSIISNNSYATECGSVDTSVSRLGNKNSPADLHGMWYPTVRRTLVCLSRLYRCVDRPIFQGLSQEALKLCIQSVSSAASKISLNKSCIDGELFEIKHLLILREQIAPFRVDFTIKETSLDFSKVKTAAFCLLQKRKQLFALGSNNALLEFLLDGTPQVKEHLLDSRKEVDRQLKLICEQFIKDALEKLISPLLAFLNKAENIVKEHVMKDQNKLKVNYVLRESVWASPQKISSVVQETQRLIKKSLPNLQRSMQLYLSNRDTEFIIFRPIRNQIIQTFVKLEQLLNMNGYTSNDMIITSCPSAEQVSVLLSSASIIAAEDIIGFSAIQGKFNVSTASESDLQSRSTSDLLTTVSVATIPTKTSSSFVEKKVSFDNTVTTESTDIDS